MTTEASAQKLTLPSDTAYLGTLLSKSFDYLDDPYNLTPSELTHWDLDISHGLSTGKVLKHCGHIMLAKADIEGLNFDVLAHSEIAGLAIANGMGWAALERGQQVSYAAANLDVSNTERYGYGLHGPDVENKKVVLVAGHGATGLALASLGAMVRDYKGEVTDALVLVDRSKGRAAVNLGVIGIRYHSLFTFDETTGLSITGELTLAERDRVRDAVIDSDALRLGEFAFAGGQEANIKLEADAVYTYPRNLRLIVKALAKLAGPYKPSVIVPVPDGADPLGVHLGVEMDVDVAFLEKDEVRPGFKSFKFKTDRDRALVENADNLIIVEDVLNRRTSTGGVLRIPLIGEKARAVLGIWDRAMPGEADELPVAGEAIVIEPIPSFIDANHALYARILRND